MAISSSERAILDGLTTDAPWALVERFSTQHRMLPEDVNTGADIIIDAAKKLGLPVEIHEPTIYLSIPIEASVTIDGQKFRAKPPAMSHPVPDGITAPLLYIKANLKNLRLYSRDIRDTFGDSFTSWEDFKSRIKGRILITEGFGNPALTSLVQEMGGLALIVINPGANIHWGTSGMVWGSPGLDDLALKPKIPVLAVSNPDGDRIKALADGKREVTVRSVLQEGWYKQKIPIVTIPGTAEKDRYVLVHGHYDSWEVGVGDNATGDAVLLGLADTLWKNRDKLRRSVKIAWWPGHSTGRYCGSTWYADEFALDLDANCVAVVNCDSPGCRWATSYHKTTGMSELHGFITDAIEDVTGQKPAFIRPKRAGDASFFNIGISSYYSLTSTMPDDLRAEKNYYEVSGCGGNIAWHTEDDVMEIADRDILLTDLKIYTLSLLRHAGAELVPGDWRVTADEFAEVIGRYKKAAGGKFDFAPLEAETAKLKASLDRFYEAAKRGAIPAAKANDTVMKLCRILIPLNYARVLRFAQDPAIACPQLPGLSAANTLANSTDGHLVNAALTDLRRGANRYLIALREARALLDGAVA